MTTVKPVDRSTGKPVKRRRDNPEDRVHIEIARFLDLALPANFVHQCVENGGGRSKREASVLKARGVKAGFPDHMILAPADTDVPPILLLEIKRPDGKGRVSDAQRDFHTQLNALGHPVAVVKSIREVAEFLADQGVPLRARPT